MKKTVLATLLAVGVSSLGFAQGYVTWNASPGQFVIGQTNSTVYSGLSGAVGGGQSTGSGTVGNTVGGATSLYYYDLLVSTADSASPTAMADLSANWSDTGLMMTNGPAANGRLNPSTPISAGAVSWSGSGAEEFMLVGWSANLGTTYATVLNELNHWNGSLANAFFGESSAASIVPSSTSTAGVTLFGSAVSGLISNTGASPMELFELQPTIIPEPGTMALAVLGGASMLLFRRKK